MDAGLYTITNTRTGRVYIGGTLHVNARLDEHRRELRFDRHNNRVLQADWNAQKGKGFEFRVEKRFAEPTDAYRAEKELFDRLRPAAVPLYNLRFDGNPRLEMPEEAPLAPKVQTITASIPTEDFDRVREIVDARREKEKTWGRRGLSQWIREAVREKLERDITT